MSMLSFSTERKRRSAAAHPHSYRNYEAPGRVRYNAQRLIEAEQDGYAAQRANRIGRTTDSPLRCFVAHPPHRFAIGRVRQAWVSGWNQSVLDQFLARRQKTRAASGD